MKSEESKYLIDEKLRNGKGLEQAKEELKQFKQSQFEFKNLKKELINKDKEIIRLNKQIEKLQKFNFKNILPKEEQIKQSKNNEATLRDLNRILSLIEIEKKIGLNDLTKTCIIKPKTMKGALNFLIKYNLIKQQKESSGLFIIKNE